MQVRKTQRQTWLNTVSGTAARGYLEQALRSSMQWWWSPTGPNRNRVYSRVEADYGLNNYSLKAIKHAIEVCGKFRFNYMVALANLNSRRYHDDPTLLGRDLWVSQNALQNQTIGFLANIHPDTTVEESQRFTYLHEKARALGEQFILPHNNKLLVFDHWRVPGVVTPTQIESLDNANSTTS